MDRIVTNIAHRLLKIGVAMSTSFNIYIKSSGDEWESMQQAARLKTLLAGNQAITVLGGPAKISPTSEGVEARADPVTLTAIALAFFTSGAAKATAEAIRDAVSTLISAIKASDPAARTSRVHYVIEDTTTGHKVELDATDLTKEQVDKALEIEALLRRSLAPAAVPQSSAGPPT